MHKLQWLGMWVLLTVLIGCASSQSTSFSKRDVRKAQKLYGLTFAKQPIDTMYRYLQRNNTGYDSLRQYVPDFQLEPALYFDPRPTGFLMPLPAGPINWTYDEPVKKPIDTDSIAFLSVGELGRLLRSGAITSEALTQIYLDRIMAYDTRLLSVITLTKDRAMKQAKRADEELQRGIDRGPLHGIPYGVKDLAAVAGYPTTWGAEPYKNQVLDYTATVVERLDSAGAVLIAKLVSGSLARGDVWYGGKTKNPWDLSQGASGSSAGSASATAAGLVAFSIGTETLGSITSPATRCGVSGLRPTYGRVPRSGFMTLSWSMDKVGPICRTAFDCGLVLSAIMGPDGKDQTVVEAPFSPQKNRPLSELRVAYLKEAFEKDSSNTGQGNDLALEEIQRLGIKPVPVSLPDDFPWEAFDIILRSEAGAFFDEFIRSGWVDKMVQQGYGSRANSLRQSRFIPAVEYLQANRQRKRLMEEMHKIIREYDVLVSPSRGSRQLFITNLTGHPAFSLPTGFDTQGRPTSITLIGQLYGEAALLELAHHFQVNTSFDDQHPSLDKK